MVRRLLILSLLASVLVVARAGGASACSCVPFAPEEALERSDAAFVGRLVGRSGLVSSALGGEARWTFEVERSVKGDLGERVAVRSPVSGAACGFELAEGERAGVLIRLEGGEATGGLCTTMNPDVLLVASQPLRRDGDGEVRFLLAGGSGRVRLLALDARGGVLGWSGGEGWLRDVSVCPGDRRVAELVGGGFLGPSEKAVAGRDLATFEVVGRLPLPGGEEGDLVSRLWCRDESGSDIVAFGTDHGFPTPTGTFYTAQAGELTPIARGPWWQAEVVGEEAVVVAGGGQSRLELIDLRTGDGRLIHEVTGESSLPIEGFAVSPDQSRVAFELTDYGEERPRSTVFVYGIHPPTLLARGTFPLEGQDVGWVGPNRLFLSAYGERDDPPPALILDPDDLSVMKEAEDWRLGPARVTDGVIYTITDGRLASFALESGALETLRVLPSEHLVHLAVLENGPEVSAGFPQGPTPTEATVPLRPETSGGGGLTRLAAPGALLVLLLAVGLGRRLWRGTGTGKFSADEHDGYEESQSTSDST